MTEVIHPEAVGSFSCLGIAPWPSLLDRCSTRALMVVICFLTVRKSPDYDSSR